MIVLYLETNFPLSIALGRDTSASQIFDIPCEQVLIAFPEICLMEAIYAFESEMKRQREFFDRLSHQASQLQRNRTSPLARVLLGQIQEVRMLHAQFLDDLEKIFREVLERLAKRAEFVSLSPEALLKSFTETILPDARDNLIAHCILSHAFNFPKDTKVLLSSDEDFHSESAMQKWKQGGIEKVFRSAEDFIRWWRRKGSNHQKTRRDELWQSER